MGFTGFTPSADILALGHEAGWTADTRHSQVVATAVHTNERGTWEIRVEQFGGSYEAVVVLKLDGLQVDGLQCHKADWAVLSARRWWDNIRADRHYRYRPRTLEDFHRKAWSPPGPRLHVLLLPSATTTAELSDRYGPTLAACPELVRPVPPDRMHITLGWAPMPAAAITAAQREELHNVLRAALPPLTAALDDVKIGHPAVYGHGVRCHLSPQEPVRAMMQVVVDAFRAVVDDAQPAPPLKPHLALAYSTADTADARPLHDQLHERASLPLHTDHDPTLHGASTAMVDADTFATNPWEWHIHPLTSTANM